jgi:dsDNA-binding SOS-regulon protein
MSKYGAVRTEVDGISFASKKEARRYSELKLLERAGEIADLQLQPRFPLTVNGVRVCTYVADFQYRDIG